MLNCILQQNLERPLNTGLGKEGMCYTVASGASPRLLRRARGERVPRTPRNKGLRHFLLVFDISPTLVVLMPQQVFNRLPVLSCILFSKKIGRQKKCFSALVLPSALCICCLRETLSKNIFLGDFFRFWFFAVTGIRGSNRLTITA